ncbi:hypothetical protein, partial [Alloprevotella tannerae]|uniref:hypothetical protein n=1 Tax=Alloprevotella tannerae TaxID=76122 RepID=UPI0028E51B70
KTGIAYHKSRYLRSITKQRLWILVLLGKESGKNGRYCAGIYKFALSDAFGLCQLYITQCKKEMKFAPDK